ncbi:LCP family protein [Streptomyces sp. NPDC057681]|uniref:LCP family protein n=1 Tax=Streptomyces sp. NPDC057681 TaxID=3346209 RepID=UPI0036C5EC15
MSRSGVTRSAWSASPGTRGRRSPRTGKRFPAHPAKINAAFAEGGPALSVRTVEAMTHVRVDHYLQIDFRQFMNSVSAVDGVDVCTSRRLSDSATKLDLRPGRHRLGGGQALQYVRSRHVDASADLGRIQRQNRFLINVVHRLAGRVHRRAHRRVQPGHRRRRRDVKWDKAGAKKTFATLNKDRTPTPRNSTVKPSAPRASGSRRRCAGTRWPVPDRKCAGPIGLHRETASARLS